MNEEKPGWERKALEKLLHAQVIEQRRTRRWGIFFKLVVFTYLFTLLILIRGGDQLLADLFDDDSEVQEQVAVINIDGLISSTSTANAREINFLLREAFDDEETVAVMLRINSGGGSPVQSGLIHDEILRLREQHEDIPVYAVISDAGASGAYYIAVAADEIYADRGSIVGSIGVRLDSFGVVELMERWGIERRLFTSGENKALLDPFTPIQTSDITHVEAVIGQIHDQFVQVVQNGRGERLNGDESLFSGLIWTGAEALELGLIDGLGDDRFVAREIIGVDRLVVFRRPTSFWDELMDDLFTIAAKRIANWQTLPQWR